MITGHLGVSKEDVLTRVSERELFSAYCPGFERVGEFFPGNLRSSDSLASAHVEMLSGKLRYKDFGDSNNGSMDIWAYVGARYGLNFLGVVDKISQDFNLNHSTVPYPSLPTHFTGEQLPKKQRMIKRLQIKQRQWQQCDKEYWSDRYFITRNELELFNVAPISDFWIDYRHIRAEKQSYCYNYYYFENYLLRKIYQPLSETYKWYSNINSTVVQGIDNIPKTHPLLIITKSMKDLIILHKLGYPAIAPNNEMGWIPDAVWAKFLQRYPKMVILFDTDPAGIASAQKFSQIYNLPYINIPAAPGVKDISDFVYQSRSLGETAQLMEGLLRDVTIR